MKKEFIMKRLQEEKESLEQQGYDVAYICIYGSQNYNLDIYTDEYKSDLDMKAIVVPNLEEIVRQKKPVSFVKDIDDGQCDVKDIRKFFEVLVKGNPAYLETIFTDYFVVDDKYKDVFDEIFSIKDEFVLEMAIPISRAMYGMALEKQKALKHPYPTIAHKIEKWGYDGKQAHHVLRLQMLIDALGSEIMGFRANGIYSYGESLKIKNGWKYRILMDLKLNKPSLEGAEEIVLSSLDSIKLYKNRIEEGLENKVVTDKKYQLLNLSNDIIIKKITEDILND